MLQLIRQNLVTFKYPLFASLSLAFAGLGDAFLYPYLPQYGGRMNIPAVWIGLLLSINRFIRIVFNPVVVSLFKRYGIRPMIITASILAIISTAGYGLGWGLASLVVFRLVWGMAYAILRIGVLAYSFESNSIGVSLGISRSVQEVGPLFALWIGPILLNYFSPGDTFLLLAIISIPAVLYAITLPDLEYDPVTEKKSVFQLPSQVNIMTFMTSFIVDGVLIIVTGLFILKGNPLLANEEIVFFVACYLLYRRACYIFISPVCGVIAEKVGFVRLFRIGFLMIITGLILLLSGWVSVGLVLVFTFNAMNATVTPVIAWGKQVNKIKAVAANASWWDMGAATGALAGGLLLSGNFVYETFTTVIFILSYLLFICFAKSTSK